MNFLSSKRNQITILFFNFFILSALGTLLRYLHLQPTEKINYKYLLEAHSHFAFSGVLLLSVLAALQTRIQNFCTKIYNKLFIILVIESYVMLFLFFRYGYQIPSIIASTIYLLTTYFLVYQFYIDSKKLENKVSRIILLYALFFMLLSSIAPWCMGTLMVLKYAGKPIYYNTVYFYLHFQYNGFFTFCVLFLSLDSIKDKIILYENKIKLYIHTFAIATLLTYFISTLWCNPNLYIRIIAFLGAILQLIAISYFLNILKSYLITSIWKMFIAICFVIKTILMLSTSLPFFHSNLMNNRQVIIAFLHLTFIGTLWLSYLYFIIRKHLAVNSFFNFSIILFIISFVLTEIVLFSTALPISKFINSIFDNSLFILALMMLLSSLFLLLSHRTKST